MSPKPMLLVKQEVCEVEGIEEGVFDHGVESPIEDDGIENMSPASSTAKMQRMQHSLVQVTQRLVMLEKEVAKKNESRPTSEAIYGPQIVTLLTGLLTEMKKMNSNTSHKLCSHNSNNHGGGGGGGGCSINLDVGDMKVHHMKPMHTHQLSVKGANKSTEPPVLVIDQAMDVTGIAGLTTNSCNFIQGGEEPSSTGSSVVVPTASSSSLELLTPTPGSRARSSTTKEGMYRLSDDGKMQVTIADGTIAVQHETFFRKC